MTMVFNQDSGYGDGDAGNQCPRCQFPTYEDALTEIHWLVYPLSILKVL